LKDRREQLAVPVDHKWESDPYLPGSPSFSVELYLQMFSELKVDLRSSYVHDDSQEESKLQVLKESKEAFFSLL
jgi:hypothetical protein